MAMILAQFPNIQVNQGPGGPGIYGSGPTFSSGQRALFCDGSAFYLAWAEAMSGTDTDIMFSFTQDTGRSWSTPVRVDDAGPDDTLDQEDPAVFVDPDANTVYIAYRDWSTGNARIKLAVSTDQGSSWTVHSIDTASSNHNLPSLVARHDTVWMAWQDDRNGDFDILFGLSTDQGASWSEPVVINDVSSGMQRAPSLALAGDALVVAWSDARNSGSTSWDVYFARSTDRGASWSPNTRLNTDNTGEWQIEPSVAARGDTVFVAWLDARNLTPWHIYADMSLDGGLSWAGNQQVDDMGATGTGGGDQPSAWISNGKNHLAWQDDRADQWHIYYDVSCDGGLDFGTDIQVDDNSASSVVSASVAGAGNRVVVAWSDNRRTGSLVYDVFAAWSEVCTGAEERATATGGLSWSYINPWTLKIIWPGRAFDARLFDATGRRALEKRAESACTVSAPGPGVFFLRINGIGLKLIRP